MTHNSNENEQLDQEKTKKTKQAALREALSWVRAVAIAVFAALIIRSFIFTPVIVSGSSMVPTLENGELMIATGFVRYVETIRRGDIVIVVPPDIDRGEYYVKRVIGLPGDTVRIQDGVVYVNGEALDEPYINEKPAYTLEQVSVSEDEYFLLGDNRNRSSDSHVLGMFPKSHIQGKVVCVVYPFDRIRGIQ